MTNLTTDDALDSAEFITWAENSDSVDVGHLTECEGCRADVVARYNSEQPAVPETPEYVAVSRDHSPGFAVLRTSDYNVAVFNFEVDRDDALDALREGERVPYLTWTPHTDAYWDVLFTVPETASEAPSEPTPATPAASTLEEVWAALGKQANERNWCPEYDQFAAAHGGPARPARMRSYTVYARVPVQIEMPEHPEGSGEAIAAWYNADPDAARNALKAGSLGVSAYYFNALDPRTTFSPIL